MLWLGIQCRLHNYVKSKIRLTYPGHVKCTASNTTSNIQNLLVFFQIQLCNKLLKLPNTTFCLVHCHCTLVMNADAKVPFLGEGHSFSRQICIVCVRGGGGILLCRGGVVSKHLHQIIKNWGYHS